VKPLTQALAELGVEPPRVNSDWERDLLDFCDDFNIPRPELNVIVEGYLVDALWREAMVIVELDSWSHHRCRTAFEDDRERDAVLDLAGYSVLRITWRRMKTNPGAVADQLRRRVGA
jgi:very-short-patch-repair endonuclease